MIKIAAEELDNYLRNITSSNTLIIIKPMKKQSLRKKQLIML